MSSKRIEPTATTSGSGTSPLTAWARSTVATAHSILVDEETDDSITIRAASETGTIWSASKLWLVLWRHDWLPHRWTQFGEISDFPDNPSKRGWRWRKHNFFVRDFT